MPPTDAAQLFPAPPTSAPKPAYRVSVAGGLVVARSPNLAFALAQARALAIAGYQVWMRDHADHCAEISIGENGLTAIAASPVAPPWLDTCRALLDDHG